MIYNLGNFAGHLSADDLERANQLSQTNNYAQAAPQQDFGIPEVPQAKDTEIPGDPAKQINTGAPQEPQKKNETWKSASKIQGTGDGKLGRILGMVGSVAALV